MPRKPAPLSATNGKCEGAGPAPESRHGAYSVRSSRGLLRRFCAAPFIYAAPTLCWGGGGIEVGGVHPGGAAVRGEWLAVWGWGGGSWMAAKAQGERVATVVGRLGVSPADHHPPVSCSQE